MNLLTLDSPFEIKSLSASGMFSGYGSVYDVPDQCEDIVAAGCFTDSLADWAKKGSLPAMLWQHKSAEPIGVYQSMSEDGRGLYVTGQLALKTQRGAEAYELMKLKAISGLSIGYVTRDDSIDRKTWVRTIKKADLWEVSPVTFPMNDAARVDDVKSAVPTFESPSQFERYLRDVHSVTKANARAIATEVKKLFRRDAGEDHTQAIMQALTCRTRAMKAADDPDTTPDVDDACSLAGGCCMPGETCNAMGKCMASAIGASGPA